MATISRDYAMKLWKKRYGDKKYVRDCFGVWMYVDDYNDLSTKRSRLDNGKQYNYGWSIDHILPKAKGGKDNDNNLEIMNAKMNIIKSDNLEITFGNGKFFVRKIDGKSYYAIFDEKGMKVSKN